MAILVDLKQVSARRSDKIVFEELALTVSDGDRIGVVGINGTGKSTLLRLVAGVEPPETGRVLRGRGVRVGYLEQEPELARGRVRDAVDAGWEGDAALERLGMGRRSEADAAELSGGQAKRVALAAVLARPAELLVLDEPTNHLDLGAVAWLEVQLLGRPGGLVLVSHDRHLLDRCTTRMLELDRGRGYVHEGGYASYLEARAEREELAVSAERSRRNLARRELAWLRRGAPARTRKPQARIDAATRVVEGRAEQPARAGELALGFRTPRLGDKVVEMAGVAFAYDAAGPRVLAEVDLVLDPRERLGVVGANGTGKSTLLDLVCGRRAPTVGTVQVGQTVVCGYYDQKSAELDPAARVRDLVAGPTRAPGAPEDVALMERFWFTGELPFARVGTLSGGERRRLQLLLVLAGRPNLLVLDEPTNDLDLDTLRILEDFLEDWPGALVVVSHDRTFLDRVTERLVAVDETGRVAAVPGGVAGWVEQVTRRDGATSAHAARPVAPARPATLRGSPRAGVPATPAGSPRRRQPEVGQGSPSTIAHRLRQVEKELTRLTRRRDELVEAMRGLVDHVELARVGSDLAAAQASLDEAEERWIELAELAEAAKG
ncbi:MAG: ABC-F family ATP-binding cassette domain-containing protein [Acidimicrobiales bacterium]